MSYDEKKLTSFKNTILENAKKKAKELEETAFKYKEEELEKTFNKTKREETKKLNEKINNLENEYTYKLTKKSYDIEKELLSYRNNIIEKIYSLCEENIEKFTKTQEYEEYLVNKIKENLTNNLSNNITIKINEQDAKFENKIKNLKENIKIEVDRKNNLGGFIIIDNEKLIEIDETFKTALNEIIKKFYETPELNLKNF